MSLFSSIRDFGRAIDPTNANSALGGYVKQAISAVPGVGAAAAAGLTAAGQANAARAAAARAGVPTTTGGPLPASSGSPTAAPSPWWASPVVLGLGAVLAVVAFVFMRKR